MKRSQQQTQTTSTGHVPVGSATKSRHGFSLIELLVAMAIIGILVGMLAVSIGPVITRVYDGAVTTEMKQIELALESFKNEYGFYPPKFGGTDGIGITTPAQLLPYLNKISPNHREGITPMPGNTGVSRLGHWWSEIGSNLDGRSSLVFWLSSVCANKQFPLTGGLPAAAGDQPQLPAAFGLSQVVVGTGSGKQEQRLANGAEIPRDSFFDFRGGQLADRGLDFVTPAPTSVALPAGIRIYNTPYGNEDDNRGNAYIYRNSEFYRDAMGRPQGVYHIDPDPSVIGDEIYANPNTFQLFTYGRDGEAADRALNYVADPDDPDDLQALESNQDNLTNFANGRVDNYDFQESLGWKP